MDKEELKNLIKELEIKSLFTDRNEKNYAMKLAEKYFEDYGISGEAEKQTLRTIIYDEIIKKRFEKFMNEHQDDKDDKSLPLRAIENYNALVEQCEKLKKTLGITRAQQQEKESDSVKAMQQMEDTFKEYILENRDSFSFQCPVCQEWTLIYRRCSDKAGFIRIKHPMFKNSELYNEPLFELYEQGILTFIQIAKILSVPMEFIEKIYSEIYLIEKKKK